MAIDMKPEVGRIVLPQGRKTEFFPWYEKGGVITRIAGKRVYYKTEGGDEKFIYDYAAVVDTKDEADELLDFSKKGKALVEELREHLEHMQNGIIARAAYEPAPVVVKRTRKRS